MCLLASRNTPAFPVSLVKRYERMVISGEIRGLCLVIVSSVSIDFYALTDTLCRLENIPNIGTTVHSFYQAMAVRYQIQREENFAS